ncbi:hypothetical protein O3M35_010552 [Rhynocoris fuscipes]|uniref:Uncharacterized protein n=1 Tax=Rhynocoris fuscipes TaxID=488301 RepID=A0AAW1D6F1_9HEMI
MDSLINLDSPINRNRLNSNYTSDSPLIPCTSISTPNVIPNNPFDEVVCSVELNQRPDDPFDVVLQEALQGNDNMKNKTELISIEAESKNDDRQSNDDSKSSSCFNENNDDDDLKNKIREFVSERLFKSFKKTLNSSRSQTDLSQSVNSTNKYFQRSSSTGLLRKSILNNVEEESECCNCGHKLNTSLPVDFDVTSNSRKAINTSGNLFLKSDDSKNTFDLKLSEQELREESEKIRRLIKFERIRNNSDTSQNVERTENLEDVKPPWESRDFSFSDEEDSIGLPKLKKIRYSLGTLSSAGNQNVVDESALNKYLQKRYSQDLAQLDDLTKMDDSIQSVECFSPEQIAASSSLLEDEIAEKIDKIEIEAPKLKDVIEDKKIETHLIKDKASTETLRPKKKGASEILKKGPMKAVIPLQKMSKNLSAKITSPFKNKMTRSSKVNKKDEKPPETINPVAASTPTKSSPDSDVSISSLRGRENNKMSPTGRKAVKRSQSTSKVEMSKNLCMPPRSVSSSQVASGSTGVNKVGNAQSKTGNRPHSAPAASPGISSQRHALKALVPPPSPIQKSKRSSDLKSSLTAKQSTKSIIKDKENQAKLKKK